MIRPSIEYGGEIWEGKKGPSSCIRVHCSGGSWSKEAVRGDMGLESLKG